MSVPAERHGCRTRDGGRTHVCSHSGRTTSTLTDRWSFFFSDHAERARACGPSFNNPALEFSRAHRTSFALARSILRRQI